MSQRGVSAVELAITLPIIIALISLFIGVLFLGYFRFGIKDSLDRSLEVARDYSSKAGNPDSLALYLQSVEDAAVVRAQSLGLGAWIGPNEITINVPIERGELGDFVEITAEVPLEFTIPLFGNYDLSFEERVEGKVY